jgi:hypothetical protein
MMMMINNNNNTNNNFQLKKIPCWCCHLFKLEKKKTKRVNNHLIFKPIFF